MDLQIWNRIWITKFNILFVDEENNKLDKKCFLVIKAMFSVHFQIGKLSSSISYPRAYLLGEGCRWKLFHNHIVFKGLAEFSHLFFLLHDLEER